MPDSLTGYRLSTVVIDDPEVVAESGSDMHPILHPNSNALPISGMAFELTAEELAAADAYETDAYVRVEARLRSGRTAFVYVAA